MRSALAALALAAGGGLACLNTGAGALREEPLRPTGARFATDEHLETARRYAPWILHAFHPELGRQDVPAPLDFDGDLNGENNWENLPRYELVPTVQYTLLETETHRFLTYHLFHPRDWATFDFGLHATHEGDGENLQVVVDKPSGRPVLLFTQAHYRGGVYAGSDGFGAGDAPIRGPLVLVDGEGRPSAGATHAVVFVEAEGHGIYGAADPCAEARLDGEGRATFDRAGWSMRPARAGEDVAEPPLASGRLVPYRLVSLPARIGAAFLAGEVTGEGRLLDGAVPYADERVRVDLPRYHEADRYSGPFGPDRGISPFAVDFGFGAGEVGRLFFDPAGRYPERIAVPEPWSRTYVVHPFARP